MNKYKIEFSEKLKKEYGLKDFIVTTQAKKEDYLSAVIEDIYKLLKIEDPQLLNDNNINVYEA